MVTNDELKAYRKFVKFLKKMVLLCFKISLYKTSSKSHKSKIDNFKCQQEYTKEGLISILVVTEKQFANITNILGDHTSDVLCSDERLVEL